MFSDRLLAAKRGHCLRQPGGLDCGYRCTRGVVIGRQIGPVVGYHSALTAVFCWHAAGVQEKATFLPAARLANLMPTNPLRSSNLRLFIPSTRANDDDDDDSDEPGKDREEEATLSLATDLGCC